MFDEPLGRELIDMLTATSFGYWALLVFLGLSMLSLLYTFFWEKPARSRAISKEQRTYSRKELFLQSYLLDILVFLWAVETFIYLVSR